MPIGFLFCFYFQTALSRECVYVVWCSDAMCGVDVAELVGVRAHDSAASIYNHIVDTNFILDIIIYDFIILLLEQCVFILLSVVVNLLDECEMTIWISIVRFVFQYTFMWDVCLLELLRIVQKK